MIAYLLFYFLWFNVRSPSGVVQARFYIPSDPGQEPIIRPYVDILRKAWIRERKTIQSPQSITILSNDAYFRQVSIHKKIAKSKSDWVKNYWMIRWIVEIDASVKPNTKSRMISIWFVRILAKLIIWKFVLGSFIIHKNDVQVLFLWSFFLFIIIWDWVALAGKSDFWQILYHKIFL